MAELDCTALRLADGEPAPVFNTKRESGARKECVDDYVTFREVSAISARQGVQDESIRVNDIQGIGLISFLGLAGQGTFVAGGVNQIETWAQQVGCSANASSTFASCHRKLKKAL